VRVAGTLPDIEAGRRKRLMAGQGDGLQRLIFIIQLDRGERGRVTGVVERVGTGEKARVESLADVGQVVSAMLAHDDPQVA
jgi:hypothetical protein